jgi:hypothetical protein
VLIASRNRSRSTLLLRGGTQEQSDCRTMHCLQQQRRHQYTILASSNARKTRAYLVRARWNSYNASSCAKAAFCDAASAHTTIRQRAEVSTQPRRLQAGSQPYNNAASGEVTLTDEVAVLVRLRGLLEQANVYLLTGIGEH